MASNVPPKNEQSPEEDDDASRGSSQVSLFTAIVQDLDKLIHDNWPAITHSEQPWPVPFTDALCAIQFRAAQLTSTTSTPRLPSFEGPIPGSTYTVSPAIPTSALAAQKRHSPGIAAAAGPNLLASAAVFDAQQRLLLVQRAPTDFFPLKWELPGGSVDVNRGESMVAGAVRELYEETGLVARAVARRVGMERTFEEGMWRQGVFEVRVVKGEEEVRLDPEEHVAWLWVMEEDVRMGRCGGVVLEYAEEEEWRGLLLRAFEGRRVGERLVAFGLDGFW